MGRQIPTLTEKQLLEAITLLARAEVHLDYIVEDGKLPTARLAKRLQTDIINFTKRVGAI